MKTTDKVDQDISFSRLQGEIRELRKKYASLIKRQVGIETERNAAVKLSNISNHLIPHIKTSGTDSEATAVILASDWHIEETVKAVSVSGLNRYNLDIATARIEKFWQVSARMVKIFKRDIKIPHIVLWLGGDFISGNIHDELLETCSLLPIEAIIKAQALVAGGIQYLLDHTDCKITVVTSVGNHTRITQKSRIATEIGNSLELFMYSSLADHFSHNKRVNFILPSGYHTYVKVYDYMLRFHHGHWINYAGGIGGIFIPTFKAISQWNKARKADYDFFGHFHQAKDGGSFLVNGSIIGYNAYALSIKADFESPRQMFMLIDAKRGKTLTCPIILDGVHN